MSSESSQTSPEGATETRQRAMAVFAQATCAELERGIDAVPSSADWRYLRPPEIGLVMVRGRIGGGGAPFNMGEVTVTRCTVLVADGATGTSYVMGRDKEKARLAALCDAFWQMPDIHPVIEAEVLEPVAQRRQEEDRETSSETAATRVDFFTMVRGED